MADSQLIEEIRRLAERPGDLGLAFPEAFLILCRFRDGGGSQSAAQAALTVLHDEYRDQDETKMDFVDDLLDCVVGWTGKPEYRVWDQPLA